MVVHVQDLEYCREKIRAARDEPRRNHEATSIHFHALPITSFVSVRGALFLAFSCLLTVIQHHWPGNAVITANDVCVMPKEVRPDAGGTQHSTAHAGVRFD